MYVGKAPLQAGQKLYLYKKVMESIHKTPWHMILAPGALVCPKACDSVILSPEILLALPGTIPMILFRSSEEHSGIASHITIGIPLALLIISTKPKQVHAFLPSRSRHVRTAEPYSSV